MTPQTKLILQIFDLKKAIDFTLTNLKDGRWLLKANDGKQELVFTMSISDLEAGQILLFLAKLPRIDREPVTKEEVVFVTNTYA